MKRNPHIGSSLNNFLREQGILKGTRAASLQRCHPERSEVVRISGRRTEPKDPYKPRGRAR